MGVKHTKDWDEEAHFGMRKHTLGRRTKIWDEKQKFEYEFSAFQYFIVFLSSHLVNCEGKWLRFHTNKF